MRSESHTHVSLLQYFQSSMVQLQEQWQASFARSLALGSGSGFTCRWLGEVGEVVRGRYCINSKAINSKAIKAEY